MLTRCGKCSAVHAHLEYPVGCSDRYGKSHRAEEAPDDILPLVVVGPVEQARPHTQQQPVASQARDLLKETALRQGRRKQDDLQSSNTGRPHVTKVCDGSRPSRQKYGLGMESMKVHTWDTARIQTCERHQCASASFACSTVNTQLHSQHSASEVLLNRLSSKNDLHRFQTTALPPGQLKGICQRTECMACCLP